MSETTRSQYTDEMEDIVQLDFSGNNIFEADELEFAETGIIPIQAPSEFTHVVEPVQVGERLDKLLTELKPELGLSRTHVQRLVEENNVLVNDKVTKAGYKLKINDRLWVHLPPPAPLRHLVPENIPLNVVYEDADIMVINKPSGLVVHPAPGHESGTLVNALLYHVPGLSINGNERPGIVHRLDKDTSGLLVVAKNDAALQNLINQMKEHKILKEYLTLVEGNVQPPNGIIDAPIGRDPGQRKQMAIVNNGKPARTAYYVSEYLPKHSYVQARLETGRTHQIRVHFAFLGHPVAGDPVYGRRKQLLPLKRQFLHAFKLGLRLPSNQQYMEWQVPLPADLQSALEEAKQLL